MPSDAAVAVDVVVLGEESFAERLRVVGGVEGSGEVVQVLHGLELRFGVGVAVRDPGPEWARVTPRSEGSAETGWAVMEVPRSACTACGQAPLRAIASSRKSLASMKSSRAATIHPRVNREQLSIKTYRWNRTLRVGSRSSVVSQRRGPARPRSGLG